MILSFSGHDSKSSPEIESNDYRATSAIDYSAPSYSNYGDGERSENTIDRDTAIQDHWDEIKEHMNGSETVEACSGSGCYDLDADISNGNIEQVDFPNGGYLSPDEEISSDGSASSYDSEGESWDYNVDMNSGTVDDAVQEWADDNGYTVE